MAFIVQGMFSYAWIHDSHVICPSIKSNPQVLKCICGKWKKKNNCVWFCWEPYFVLMTFKQRQTVFKCNSHCTKPTVLDLGGALWWKNRNEASVSLYSQSNFKSFKIQIAEKMLQCQTPDVCKILQVLRKSQDFPWGKRLMGNRMKARRM